MLRGPIGGPPAVPEGGSKREPQNPSAAARGAPRLRAQCQGAARRRDADETPVRMLDSGAGKTAKADVWADARGEHDGTPDVIDDFCTGQGSKYPADSLAEWTVMLGCDDHGSCDVVFKRDG